VKEGESMSENKDIEGQRASVQVRAESNDEIELIDYLRILWSYRFWIIGATILSALVALVISFILPPVWGVSVVAEPGKFGSDLFEVGTSSPTGRVYSVDTAENIKAKILQGSYDSQVRGISGWPPNEKIKWDVNVERDCSAIRASLEVKDKELGLKALEVLVTSLEKEQAEKIGTFQRGIDQEIIKKNEDITKVEKEIGRVKNERDANLTKLQEEAKELKNEIALLKQRESELSKEEEGVRKNTELLITKRNSLIEGEQSRSDPVALVLFTTSIQQNIAYSNQLSSQLNDVKRAIEEKGFSVKKAEIEVVRIKEDASLRIKKLESDIVQIKASIKVFEGRRKFAKAIEIIQKPTVSYKPVKPKKLLNSVIAGILGLFVSILGAFFTEYISIKKRK
jgi:uncharacterized protein involved in exopolysaccharide biosynthesis